MDNKLKKIVYEKCFLLQKYLTYAEYLEKNPFSLEKIENILKECGIHKSLPEDAYIIEKGTTILIFIPFDYDLYIYAVCAIYTDKKNRNKGSAKKLLTNLDFFGSLYFDTYTPELIKLLKNIGAREKNVIKNKPSAQFILDINKTPSIVLINKVTQMLHEN